MPLATHARTVADRCRKATFEAPGSLVRGTVRVSTSKPALFWDRQRKRAFQVTMSLSKAMTSKWKYRISVHRKMVVWVKVMPRSSIIWNRSRELSLKVRYHRTQYTMISWSKVPAPR